MRKGGLLRTRCLAGDCPRLLGTARGAGVRPVIEFAGDCWGLVMTDLERIDIATGLPGFRRRALREPLFNLYIQFGLLS